MKNIAKLLVFLASAAGANLAAAATVDITRPLMERNELAVATFDVKPYLFDQQVQKRLQLWVQHDRNHLYIDQCQRLMRPFFHSPKIVGSLCYFFRQKDVSKRRGYLPLAWRYYLEVRSALFELSTDPRYAFNDRARARKLYDLFKPEDQLTMKSCFDEIMQVQYVAGNENVFFRFNEAVKCVRNKFKLVNNQPFWAVNIAKEFPNHPGHAVTPTGWTSGNKVTYLWYNDTSNELTEELAAKHNLVPSLYPLDGAGSLEAMMAKDPSEVFTAAEGFYTMANNPLWNQEAGGIYNEMYQGIKAAKDSIFIDIFFLGGVIGTSMAKYLVERAEEGIKILILRDNYNHFGHKPEMQPLYNFLLAYSLKNPDKMVIAQSHIKAHPTGLPKMFDKFISDEFLERSGIQDHLALYGKAKSDHSKVVVIDGNTSDPVAFVGSKNWTDGAGAMAYDEVGKVEGPAAAIVLDDYYFDMFYALHEEMSASQVKTWAQKGWSAGAYSSGQSKREMVANILRPFDLLNRRANHVAKGATVKIESKGPTPVRTGMNNWDSTRTNCVDQVIQLILNAKSHIYIKDQYVFDRNVILALMRQKRENPSLDIKMILEPRPTAKPAGMPNLLYLDVMTKAGIAVKFKRVNPNPDVAHQNHMKTISADGKSVITGSANKDQTTMYGSFREEQLDIWDEGATKVHDDAFLRHWNDASETYPKFAGYDFQVPEGLKGLDGKQLNADEFMALMRNVVSILFDATRL